MNVLLLMATVIGIAGLTLLAIASLTLGQKVQAAVCAGIGAAWITLYGVGLIVTSLASHETVLAAGEVKQFCGFYIDCHIGVAVVADEPVTNIGSLRAAGTFHLVTLRLSSSAVRATLAPYHLRVQLVDANGAHYERAWTAEAERALPGSPEPLERDILPGQSYTVQVVFDVPAGVAPSRLSVGEGLRADWALEMLLIGDEDSFLHSPTTLALPTVAHAALTTSRTPVQRGGAGAN